MIPENIKQLANKVRDEIYGRDVRESIAQSMEVSGETSNEANERSKDTAGRQTDVENRFDDQIAGNTDIDEVIDARRPEGGESYPTLRKRLDDEHKEVTAQLAQTVLDIEQRSINIKKFEYLVDEGDWSVAIQKALDSLVNGGTLYFPHGTYRLGEVSINNDNITLVFHKNAILLKNGNNKCFDVKANNIIFENAFFDLENYTATTSFAIYAKNINNLQIIGCTFKNGGHGVAGYNINKFKVEDCEVDNNAFWGIIATGGNGIYFLRNECHHSNYDGLKVAGVDLSNEPNFTKNVFIKDNICYSNKRDGIDLALNNAENINISKNICFDNLLRGIDLKQVYQGSSYRNCILSDNILTNNGTGLNIQSDVDYIVNTVVKGNIIQVDGYSDGDAIRIRGGKSSNISNNFIRKYSRGIRLIHSEKCLVFDNDIEMSRNGIVLSTQKLGEICINNNIYENNIIVDDINPVKIESYEENTVTNNKIYKNTLKVINSDQYSIKDEGTNNLYWDNITGESNGNPSGRGVVGDIKINENIIAGSYRKFIATTTSELANWKGIELIED